MPTPRRSDTLILVAAGALAITVPLVGASVIAARLHDDLEPRLSAALGESVSIGGVEAELTGAVRLRDVSVGGVFTAGAIEASVGLDSLLRGRFSADEIRIDAPRLRTRIDRTGELKLRRIVQRAAEARQRAKPTGAASGSSRLRRILVTGGELRVDLEGRGTMYVHDVELHPQTGGVRLVTGPVDLNLVGEDLFASGRFGRTGADIALPELTVRRALAVEGALTLTGPRVGSVELVDAIAGKGIDGRDRLELYANVAGDDAGARVELGLANDVLEVRGTRMPLAPLAAFAPRWLQLANATATGSAELTLGDRLVAAQLDLDAEGVVIAHRHVSAEPLLLAGRAVGRGRFERSADGGVAHVDELALTTGGATLQIAGTASGFGDGAKIPDKLDVRLDLPSTACATALRAIPEPARRRLAGLSVRGKMSGRMALAFDRADPASTRLDTDVDIEGCRVLTEATAGDPRQLSKPFRHTFPDGSSAMVGPGRTSYARFNEIPRLVYSTFVAAEDARFFEHPGFDTRQIRASLAVDIHERELLRGGSTITQQLAKNVFLDPRRTFARKLEEAVLAWRLESRLDKQKILEVYLNIIELGDGVFGVRDAAHYWFAKDLHQLTPREVAFLAVLTPAPRTISRRVRATSKLDPATEHRIEVVLRHMRNAGVISRATYARALDAPLVLRAPALASNAEK
jgi:hypothetical protein